MGGSRIRVVIAASLLGLALGVPHAALGRLGAAETLLAEGEVELLAAGDIATCPGSGDEATAAILDGYPSATVAALGDVVYNTGTPQEFQDCYEPSWGRHKARTKPAVGNHEYDTPGATGYYGYFGAAAGTAGEGWYSYDLGSWHVVVLNSNCVETTVDCSATSEQVQWLESDLEASEAACTLAYWHHPLFTSGFHAGETDLPLVQPFWDVLYEQGADVILVGHDHNYERFAPQTPTGAANAQYGIRQFIVGTGGAPLRGFKTVAANSEVRESATFGVLRLTLGSGGYDWTFLPAGEATFTDTGSGTCHGAPDLTPPGPGPTLSSSHDANWSTDRTVDVTWTGASDSGSGVDGFWYSWTQTATDATPPTKLVEENASSATSPSLADGSWWFHLRTKDNAGNWSGAVHLGPFNIDATAPTNPSLSSSHAPNDWSNDNTVEATWTGASDATSGLDGFSYSWTQLATSDPGTTKTVEETASSATSGTLADGSWWFHLRTRDNRGNWTSPVHRGPFKIDTTAPTNPTLSSSSHAVGAWSSDNTVEIEWSASASSYQFAWTADGTTIPEAGPETTQTNEAEMLADGAWWFHVRARDASGSWSGTSHFGPYLIDTTAPETSVVATAAGFEFSASEPASFRCALDGAAYADCTSPARYDGLPPGDHVFRVFARDRAGNADLSPAELRWRVEAPARPPAPPPIEPPPIKPPAAVKRCVVPRLRGSTLKRAKTLLARRGCRLGRVTYAYSRVPKGVVMSQRPGATKRLLFGGRVSVRVSRGSRPRPL